MMALALALAEAKRLVTSLSLSCRATPRLKEMGIAIGVEIWRTISHECTTVIKTYNEYRFTVS